MSSTSARTTYASSSEHKIKYAFESGKVDQISWFELMAAMPRNNHALTDCRDKQSHCGRLW